ncbi:hypothetical protein F4776DRAFT_607033, partial [Hypoxylon sp. NC0597]
MRQFCIALSPSSISPLCHWLIQLFLGENRSIIPISVRELNIHVFTLFLSLIFPNKLLSVLVIWHATICL